MAYFTPYVDETGFHYPTYNDILEDLINEMQNIYGSGIYLGNDSQDYQMLSIYARKQYDAYQACEIAYNAHSPKTSIGTGLDWVVAINGISRKHPTRSVVTLTVSGTPNTVINSGIVADSQGIMWDLPDQTIIGDGGSVDVQATCREYGVVTAAENTITKIMTPVSGWISVTNASAATVGSVTETDAQLRARQAISVSLPSRTILQGILASLQALNEAGRVIVYENDTNATNADGIPAHSICCVVEGAEDQEIAETIQKKKGPGCGTYGSTAVVVTDSDGIAQTINFSRLSYVDVDIEINITSRAGYVNTIPDQIKTAIVDYLATFAIGTDLTPSIIWMVAQQVNRDVREPQFSISSVTAARHGETLSTSDVVIDFNEAARGRIANITINVS